MVRTWLLSIVLMSAYAGSTWAEPVVDWRDTAERDPPPQKKSYLVPAVEIVGGNLMLSVVCYSAGADWGMRDWSTWFEQLQQPLALDDDAYSINQIAHPFFGSLSFSAARSTGHNFWVSSAYAFAGAALWEQVIENSEPSLNDMITTPIGGMFIGEAVHRFARALLYDPRGKPHFSHRLAAALLDPAGAFNRTFWGEAWRETIPPNLYAHLGLGVRQTTAMFGNRGGDSQMHAEAYMEEGLLRDPAFQPRKPFDYFQLYAAVNAGPDVVEGELFVRGTLLAGRTWREHIRTLYGLFGAYDYNNNHLVRAAAAGVGPGGTVELAFGGGNYLTGTLIAYLVPYGAAGGEREVEGPMRDSHDGPGLAQLGELQFGRRGLYALRLTTRAYEIGGRLVGDYANEYVVQTTGAMLYRLTAHHAIGVEANYTYERADFGEPKTTEPNRATDLRVFYAITTDEMLSR